MSYKDSYWPAETSGPILDTTVGGILRDAARDAPDTVAIVAWDGKMDPGLPRDDGVRRWTYAELLRDSERTAQALLARFRPGERVAVWANNIPEWMLMEFGAALAGLVLVTVNPGYRARELAFVLKQSRAAGIFYVDEVRGNPMAKWLAEVRAECPEMREAVRFEEWGEFLERDPGLCRDDEKTWEGGLPAVKPTDSAQIQYTSGTTGFPKGALLHHRGITNNARLVMERFGFKKGDVFAHAMPFFHTGGCVCSALGAVAGRATHCFLPTFDPGLLLEMIENEQATHMFGVPTMLIAMMQHPDFATRDLSSLRAAVSGGAAVPAEVVREIESRLGIRFSIIYGQTECSPVITMTRLDDSPEDKAQTLGQPLPQTEVKIVDIGTGQTVPVGVTGELCTRGYHVMHGYFENAENTAKAIDKEGWLHTGDLASMDPRGYFTIKGRLKEMVIRGGENLFPVEIENVLHEHPEVADVAVVGVPDARMGEELVAFIRHAGREPPSEQALRAHVRANLAAQKTPRYWIFVNEFPLTGSGKVQKFRLRELWEQGEYKTE